DALWDWTTAQGPCSGSHLFQPELLQGECRVKKQKRPLHGIHRYHGTDTPGTAARYCNSDPHVMEQRRTAVDWLCRYNHEYLSRFLTERRGEPGAERVPSSRALAMTLRPLKTSLGIAPEPSALLVPIPETFCPCCVPALSQSPPPCPSRWCPRAPSPAPAACSAPWWISTLPTPTLRWFQGQQELSVVATDMVPNGDWTHQLLVLLETPTRAGLTSTCQVEHVSWEHPLSQYWDTGEELGALGEPLGCAGSNWEGVGESLVSTGRGGCGFGKAKKGFEGYWGGWDGVLGVLVDTGREFGCARCDWEGYPRDAAGCCRIKMLTGTGDSVLGFIFLGIWFYLHKKGGSRESYPTSPIM
uniref:uncharacterized protein n=1 Tax=Lonchura striata TaxID=40157 RepID=UPI0012938D35